MMGYHDYGYGYLEHRNEFEMIFVMLCWIAVISFIIYLVKRRGMCHGKHCGMFHDNSAMDILKERYAKREIEKKDLED